MKRSQPNSPSYNLDNIQKRRKSSHNEQLTTLKSYFQDLIAHRNRDPALVRRAELWTEVVDKFSEFVQLLSSACRESDDTIDFKLVGSALECATEFYAAELDALSNDVYKLTSMLQRGERSCRRESGECSTNLIDSNSFKCVHSILLQSRCHQLHNTSSHKVFKRRKQSRSKDVTLSNESKLLLIPNNSTRNFRQMQCLVQSSRNLTHKSVICVMLVECYAITCLQAI